MADKPRDLPHLFPLPTLVKESYTSPRRGGGSGFLPRDRKQHAGALESQLRLAIQEREKLIANDAEAAKSGGFYLEFRLQNSDGTDKVLDKLESLRGEHKIELMAVREESGKLVATVYVPDERQEHYLKKVEDYAEKDSRSGNPKNAPLISRVDQISVGRAASLYFGTTPLPDPKEEVWWEAWIVKNSEDAFKTLLLKNHLETTGEPLRFRERDVFLVKASLEQLDRFIQVSRFIAELRLYRENPSTFLQMSTREQREWVDDLLGRTQIDNKNQVYVCILDRGVSRAHPLIQDHLNPSHCHSQHPPSRGDMDFDGHGTGMAGLVLFGDLTDGLQHLGTVTIGHGLESSKILPNKGSNPPHLYGAVTKSGVFSAEVANSAARRVICMAVTDKGVSFGGRPTSWSASLDQLAFERDEDSEYQRLLIVSAGNVVHWPLHKSHYYTQNDAEGIESPAQAWNVLTVGAYTMKTTITNPDPSWAGYTHLAPPGHLSPTSLTSMNWFDQWPIKPDVVFEGGNAACSPSGDVDFPDDLLLLSTNNNPTLGYFKPFNATSAATALAGRMAAKIYDAYPHLWPETVRALIVHSAEWTSEMKKTRLAASTPKLGKRHLLRRFGYGVPDLDRALKSARNDLTLVIEDRLRPFYKPPRDDVKTRELNFHALPWPKQVLEQFGEAQVELRVTLSFFVEPNPGERGWSTRHSYQSHGLRFELKNALESELDFRKRINAAAREKGEKIESTISDGWDLGIRKGSVFSDMWRGNAAALAAKDAIAIYPVGGWWKEKHYLEQYERPVRYALIVSLRAPELDLDIYTPVSQAIQSEIAAKPVVEVEISVD